jgi:hypothetical protein
MGESATARSPVTIPPLRLRDDARGRGEGPFGRLIRDRFAAVPLPELRARAREAEGELFSQGITFTVYSDKDAIDRILPFDVIPRVIGAADWDVIEAGICQRVRALNLFLADVYGPQRSLAEGVIPADLVLANANYRPRCAGSPCRTAPTCTSPGPTWCATARAASGCSRTTPARPRASPTWSRTGT